MRFLGRRISWILRILLKSERVVVGLEILGKHSPRCSFVWANFFCSLLSKCRDSGSITIC